MDVTVAGWGYTKEEGDQCKLLFGFIRNHVVGNFNN